MTIPSQTYDGRCWYMDCAELATEVIRFRDGSKQSYCALHGAEILRRAARAKYGTGTLYGAHLESSATRPNEV